MSAYDYMDKDVLIYTLYERDREIERLKEYLIREARKQEDLNAEITRLKPYEQRAKISYDNWVTNAEREIDDNIN